MGLAGDHSEFAAVLDATLERWDPDSNELDELERLVAADEFNYHGVDGLFSADGRRALSAAIARRRAG